MRLTEGKSQRDLAEIAKNEKVEYVRLAAIAKLTDRAALQSIGKSDPSQLARDAAQRRLEELAGK